MSKTILIIFSIIFFPFSVFSQTIDQKLFLVSNSGFTGGNFIVDYQIKGTNLTSARTLASLNADIIYDTTLLKFNDSSIWLQQISSENGYTKYIRSNASEQNKNKTVRITILGANVDSLQGINASGYNIENNYVTIVRLNFRIVNQNASVSLTIKNITNQAGLFLNPANSPNTYDINASVLSEPIIIIDSPLPVKLISFTSEVNKNLVKLFWKTAFEQNNKGFEIERRISNENWITAGFVNGSGNSSTEKEYAFEEKNLNTGKYEYRIKQIDYNGNYQYHTLSGSVNVGAPNKFALAQNYPNPFNPSTKIDFQIPSDSKVKIILYDVSGKEVLTILDEKKTAGYYTQNINSINLSSGTYFYKIFAENGFQTFTESKKMTLVK